MQYKVLIVEDDADIVELLTLYLNSHDFQVFSAFNGMDALKIVREQDISVALVDVMMPRMNGYEFIKTVRLYTSFPIILISAKTMDEDEVLGLNLGADAYIKKPFNPLVVAQVKAVLRRAFQLDAASGGEASSVLQVGELELDMDQFLHFLYKRIMPSPPWTSCWNMRRSCRRKSFPRSLSSIPGSAAFSCLTERGGRSMPPAGRLGKISGGRM